MISSLLPGRKCRELVNLILLHELVNFYFQGEESLAVFVPSIVGVMRRNWGPLQLKPKSPEKIKLVMTWIPLDLVKEDFSNTILMHIF